jgi:hypothetical protein
MNVENFKTRGESLGWLFSAADTCSSLTVDPLSHTDAFADALDPDPPASNVESAETKVKKEKKTAKIVTPTEGKVDVQNFKSFGESPASSLPVDKPQPTGSPDL